MGMTHSHSQVFKAGGTTGRARFPKLVSCPSTSINALFMFPAIPIQCTTSFQEQCTKLTSVFLLNSRLRFGHAYASMPEQVYPYATATLLFLVFDEPEMLLRRRLSVPKQQEHTNRQDHSNQSPACGTRCMYCLFRHLHVHWSSRTINSRPSRGKRSAIGRKRRPCSTSTGPV